MARLNAGRSRSVSEYLDSVLAEGRTAMELNDSELYTYMSSSNRIARKTETAFGQDCVVPLVERLSDPSIPPPAARVLLGLLARTAPSRQGIFETWLDGTYPSWRTVLRGNPQEQLPAEFRNASERAANATLECVTGLVRAVELSARAIQVDRAIAALKAMERIGYLGFLDVAMELSGSEEPTIASQATLTASRLSALDRRFVDRMRTLAFDVGQPVEKRLAALECFAVPQGPESLREIARDHREAFIAEPRLLNLLLDSSPVDMLSDSATLFDQVDFAELASPTLRRLTRSREVTAESREAAARYLRVALDATPSPAASASRFGLIVHRNSSANAAFVGHAGLFIDEENLIHCTTGHDPTAVQSIAFSEWRDGQECWGIREDEDHPVNLREPSTERWKSARGEPNTTGTTLTRRGSGSKDGSVAPSIGRRTASASPNTATSMLEVTRRQVPSSRGPAGRLRFASSVTI